MAIRYENTVDGNESGKIYSTISDFDGEPLGSLIDDYYQNLTSTNFPNPEIIAKESFNDKYTSLLLEEIEGCQIN